jgi:3-phenylpropionate/trans-cinnamate dioxygenase ferredoxin reductase subunit
MVTAETFVIIGAGLAGAKAAETLRTEGFEGRVVLVGADPERPYNRPPLSKAYLAGSAEREAGFIHPAEWYPAHDVELRTGVRATAIDRAARTVTLADGDTLEYQRLLLATGSTPRRLTVPGLDAANSHYLRGRADSDRLREAIAGGGRVVVIGAGWIGLEVAAAARGYGCDVDVVETAPTPLNAALGPELGEVFARLHRDNGVRVLTGTGVREVEDAGGKSTVVTDSGERIEADHVIVGIGAPPHTALAEAAGLAVDNGVTVDASLRTDDAAIFAAGDIAGAYHPHYRRHIRVEHWANAENSGPVAARAMLGQEVAFTHLPYFYTDQYDLGMEYSGWVPPGAAYRVVNRGDVAGREFVAFWLDGDGRLLAGMNVNIWDVNDQVQELISSGRPLDPTRLADPKVPLTDVDALAAD